jgi:UDP-glucuronate 4-epimerase
MKLLITGSAGFIGAALSLKLLKNGHDIEGLDNMNDYYSPSLKRDRLKSLLTYKNYRHHQVGIENNEKLDEIFSKSKFDCVVNFAAQAGVRYSINNPSAFIVSNITGFSNILECCRKYNVGNLVYASSSSVYGSNSILPYSTKHNANHPLSLYAATKRSNELMAHSYSHLFQISTTGLRFFTVYGPWGRPDMALFKFTEAILAEKKIPVFNYGNHRRGFTYIDDVVDAVEKVIISKLASNKNWNSKTPDPGSSFTPWRIYNIGGNKAINLLTYIQAIESTLKIKAKLDLLPLQPGDMLDTYSDDSDFVKDFGPMVTTPINKGVREFVEWYRNYFKV